MTFAQAVSTCFRKYADFTGRAQRSEYWYFALFLFLVELGILLALAISIGMLRQTSYGTAELVSQTLSAFYALFVMATLIPTLAAGVRRLHDTGQSGWWLLIAFIPLAGPILLLVRLVRPGDVGSNAYGPDPLADMDSFAPAPPLPLPDIGSAAPTIGKHRTEPVRAPSAPSSGEPARNSPPGPRFRVRLDKVRGSGSVHWSGSPVDVGAQGLVIGRAGNLVIEHDAEVSARHCRIYVDSGPAGGQWHAPTACLVIVDGGSTNGTVVNGGLLYGPQQLNVNDEILIGNTVLRMAEKSPC